MEWLAPPSYQQWAACQSFHLVVVEVLNADLIDVLTIRKEACHAIRLATSCLGFHHSLFGVHGLPSFVVHLD
jgi:hypothetical protein